MKYVHSRKILLKDFIFKISLIVSVIIILIDIAYVYPENLNKIIAVMTVVISMFLCFIYRYNIGLFLVMIFMTYTNYSIAVGVYIDLSLRPGFMYNQFVPITYGKGIVCILIFELFLLFFSKKVINNPHCVDFNSNTFVDNYEYNYIIAMGAPIVYAILFFSSFHMGENGARGGSSALNEYRTIVEILGAYYCGRKKVYKYIWTFLVLITSLLILLSGNRIDMFGSMIFLIFFWYNDFFDYKKVLAILPSVVIIMAGVGFMRGFFSISSESLSKTINTLFKDKLTYEGAIYGYVPSLSIIELTDNIDSEEKLRLLWEHIKYTFKIGSAGSSNPDLSIYSHKYYIHFWGFISPIYFYFWIYYLGPVIFAVIVKSYNNLYISKTSISIDTYLDKVGYILSLFYISNVARWYAYGPMGLIRGMFVCFVVFNIVYFMDKSLRKKIKWST